MVGESMVNTIEEIELNKAKNLNPKYADTMAHPPWT